LDASDRQSGVATAGSRTPSRRRGGRVPAVGRRRFGVVVAVAATAAVGCGVVPTAAAGVFPAPDGPSALVAAVHAAAAAASAAADRPVRQTPTPPQGAHAQPNVVVRHSVAAAAADDAQVDGGGRRGRRRRRFGHCLGLSGKSRRTTRL